MAAIGLASFLWFRRRRPAPDTATNADRAEEVGEPAPVRPAAPAPGPTPGAALVMEFQPTAARSTLIGAAVGYRLVLRNTGDGAVEDVAVAAMIANADARQEQVLAHFFASPVADPTHRIDRIDPGRETALTGELRMPHEAIVPIRVADRELLIPIVAFNVHYRCAAGQDRSSAAFIVGQENDPPRERMAPFRLDLGPKQYRSVGSRPAQPIAAL